MTKGAMREGVITEADSCREFVTLRSIEAGWPASPRLFQHEQWLLQCRRTIKSVVQIYTSNRGTPRRENSNLLQNKS